MKLKNDNSYLFTGTWEIWRVRDNDCSLISIIPKGEDPNRFDVMEREDSEYYEELLDSCEGSFLEAYIKRNQLMGWEDYLEEVRKRQRPSASSEF